MDITSYLLGKQAGGGSTPALQNKSVKITENGTTNVTADSGYDGLSKVEVTTNVSGGGSTNKIYPYNISFRSNKDEIIDLSNVDFSKFNGFLDDMFRECNNVKELYFNNLTNNFGSSSFMFYNCSNLENANFDVINLSEVTSISSIQNMFSGCSKLTDDSLDRILIMCINCGITGSLWNIGLKYYNTSRIRALPHYQDFIDAGWSIGY